MVAPPPATCFGLVQPRIAAGPKSLKVSQLSGVQSQPKSLTETFGEVQSEWLFSNYKQKPIAFVSVGTL